MILLMSEKIILLGSVLFGAVGGIAWSGLPPTDRARAPVAAPAPKLVAEADPNVHYSGCNEVRALGRAPLYADQPGYREDMDGDLDGIACEPHREDR